MRLCLIVLGLCLTPVLHSQEFVKVQTVEKGKVIEVPFSMVFISGGREIEPLRFQNGFVVPPEITKLQFVDVRVRFKRYNLTFNSVSTKKFEGDWTVGVDSPRSPQNLQKSTELWGKSDYALCTI